MVFRRICVADGDITYMRTGDLSLVPALAVAVHPLGIGCSDYHLDRQHYSNVLRLVSAHAWPSVVGSWMDHVAGIWISGSRWRNHRFLPAHTSSDVST